MVSGAQVMLGYLNNPEKTSEAIVDLDGRRWYKTGDKGHVDKDGFLTIVDRYSRFAKIGGEMISLTAVEQAVREQLGDESMIAAVNVKDDKKGEKIILLVEDNCSWDDVKQSLIQDKVNALMIPSECYDNQNVPLLGTGKVDFVAAKRIAQSLVC